MINLPLLHFIVFYLIFRLNQAELNFWKPPPNTFTRVLDYHAQPVSQKSSKKVQNTCFLVLVLHQPLLPRILKINFSFATQINIKLHGRGKLCTAFVSWFHVHHYENCKKVEWFYASALVVYTEFHQYVTLSPALVMS